MLDLSFSGSLLTAKIGSMFRASPGFTDESPDMDRSLLAQCVASSAELSGRGLRE